MNLKSPFESKNIIGYISEVTPYNIKIHFPDSKLLKRFNNHGDSLHGGILGSFVAIEGETKGFIGKIVKLSLPEKERMSLSESNYKSKELHPVGIIEILFSFELLNFNAQKSIQDYPPISSKVYVCSSELYINILKNSENNKIDDELEIGEALGTNEKVSLPANHIFNRHCAILGTTGGGKSYTISKMIEELVKKNNAKIILLDATGEFSKFDTDLKNKDGDIISESAIFGDLIKPTVFNYKNFSYDDLCALFRPAGQTQLPLLEEALKVLSSIDKLKDKYDTGFMKDEDGKEICFIKNGKIKKGFNEVLGNSSIGNYNIKNLSTQLYLCATYDNADFGKNEKIFGDIDKNAISYLQSMIFRIKGFLNIKENIEIFNINKEEKKDLFDSIDGFIFKDKQKLFRIDLSNVPETGDIKGILVNSIGRYFLNKSKKGIYKNKPVIIFIDEAHLFLNKKVKDEYSIEVELNAFDRIAKECRKFGVFLCLSTQRPRDIPEGVLSQIGTFIVHRLINDKDKQAVENASPSYSKEFLNFLPSLGEGEAIIMGVNFLTTLFLKISKPSIEPNSNTPKLFQN